MIRIIPIEISLFISSLAKAEYLVNKKTGRQIIPKLPNTIMNININSDSFISSQFKTTDFVNVPHGVLCNRTYFKNDKYFK